MTFAIRLGQEIICNLELLKTAQALKSPITCILISLGSISFDLHHSPTIFRVILGKIVKIVGRMATASSLGLTNVLIEQSL